MGDQKARGVKRLVNAFGYSLQGLRASFKHEEAFRLEVAVFVVFVPLGLWLGEDGVERVLLVAGPFALLVVELINSALEAVVDRFGGEHHELSGRAKDIGSAAVLITIVAACLTWLLILLG